MVLLDAGRVPRFDELHRFRHRVDTHGEEAFEIERAEGVVGRNLAGFLEEDGARIDAVVGPEDAEAGFGPAEDDGPVHGGGTAVEGEEAGVVLDGAVLGGGERFLGQDLGDECHHAELGAGGSPGGQPLLALEGGGIDGREAGLFGGDPEGVGAAALAGFGSGGGDDLDAVLDQSLEHRFSEGCLTDDRDAHGLPPESESLGASLHERAPASV